MGLVTHVEIKDYSEDVLNALKKATVRGLSACGEKAVGYAQKSCPVDTGRLRSSIAYAVKDSEEACYIGTNVKYAPYIEYGTGVYAEGGGRQTPWIYQDDKGQFHLTNGSKAQPFLRPASSDHAQEYSKLLEESLKNA